MRVTALQLPACFGQPREQLARAEALLEGPRTDLVLFSEAALTGYVSADGDFDLAPFAEPLVGPTTAALAALARRLDALVVGPLVEREGPRCFNALVGLTPEGEVALHYRKRHPWYPERWATAGAASLPLVTWRGVRLTAALCFDVHFLAAESGPTLSDADLLLFASAWVDEAADDARPALLSSLAADHRCAVLNANWGRGAPALRGQGGSCFVAKDDGLQSRLGMEPARLDVEL